MQEDLDEELLERLFWEFDFERKRYPGFERDVFKGKMRLFARNGVLNNIPWWLKDKYGYPIEFISGRGPVFRIIRIFVQNLRKITG